MTKKTKHNSEEPFVEITNRDVYNKLEELIKSNDDAHGEITSRLDRTNGKVKLGFWLGTTALTVALMAVGFVFSR